MIGNIVLAWDSTRETQETLFQQRALLGGDVTVVCALDPLPFRGTLRPFRGATDELLTRRRESIARDAIADWTERLRVEGVDVDASIVRAPLAGALLDEAARRRSLAIAIAVRPPPGRTLAALVRDAPVPVLVVRETRGAGGGPQRIVVPLDVSAGVERVAGPALELAEAHDAAVVLVAPDDPTSARVRAAIDEAQHALGSGGAAIRLLLPGELSLRRLCAALDDEAPGVIVVATQPRSASSIAGATSERLISHLLLESTSSLLVVGDRARRSDVEAALGRQPVHQGEEVRS